MGGGQTVFCAGLETGVGEAGDGCQGIERVTGLVNLAFSQLLGVFG